MRGAPAPPRAARSWGIKFPPPGAAAPAASPRGSPAPSGAGTSRRQRAAASDPPPATRRRRRHSPLGHGGGRAVPLPPSTARPGSSPRPVPRQRRRRLRCRCAGGPTTFCASRCRPSFSFFSAPPGPARPCGGSSLVPVAPLLAGAAPRGPESRPGRAAPSPRGREGRGWARRGPQAGRGGAGRGRAPPRPRPAPAGGCRRGPAPPQGRARESGGVRRGGGGGCPGAVSAAPLLPSGPSRPHLGAPASPRLSWVRWHRAPSLPVKWHGEGAWQNWAGDGGRGRHTSLAGCPARDGSSEPRGVQLGEEGAVWVSENVLRWVLGVCGRLFMYEQARTGAKCLARANCGSEMFSSR